MILELNQVIGEAYGVDQIARNRPAAIQMLRDACTEPDMREIALKRRDELAAVVKMRSMGAQCGCHITKVTHDLLAEALRDANG